MVIEQELNFLLQKKIANGKFNHLKKEYIRFFHSMGRSD